MLKKTKLFLTKFLTSGKRFLIKIPYSKILALIIELLILVLILININLITFKANSYFELSKYGLAIATLFALGYLIHKKD